VKHLREYDIAHKGLRLGSHSFEYKIDASFLEHFEASPIEDCTINVGLDLDKRETIMLLHFTINGTVKAECDRCLQTIHLPIAADNILYIKFEDNPNKIHTEEEDIDIIYMSRSESIINVATFIYEFLVLNIPIKAACPFEEGPNKSCNMDMIQQLNKYIVEIEPDIDPRWEVLKTLKEKK